MYTPVSATYTDAPCTECTCSTHLDAKAVKLHALAKAVKLHAISFSVNSLRGRRSFDKATSTGPGRASPGPTTAPLTSINRSHSACRTPPRVCTVAGKARRADTVFVSVCRHVTAGGGMGAGTSSLPGGGTGAGTSSSAAGTGRGALFSAALGPLTNCLFGGLPTAFTAREAPND
jgi:hypothetical protein